MFPLANSLSPLGISAAAAVAALNYRDTVLADSPWLYYRLGESSGTTAVDASGNSRNGTYTSVTLGQTGAIAGDTDTAAGPATTSRNYLFNSSTATVEAWMRIETSVGSITLLDGSSNTDKNLRAIFDGHVHFEWMIYDGAIKTLASSNIIFGTGTAPFYHVVGTVNGSISCLYVNGSLVASTPASGSFTGYIGNNFGLGFGSGSYLDEVAIYTTALSAARVLAHYNKGIGI